MKKGKKFARIDTCIIPCAGEGTRWLPISSYIPKLMLPLRGRPILEYDVREAINSGCTEIVIVIRKDTQLIKDYLLSVREFKEKANLHFVVQENGKRGMAETVILSEKYIRQSKFILLVPDIAAFYKGKPPLKCLIEKYQKLKLKSHAYGFSPYPKYNALFFEYKLKHRKEAGLIIEHICPKPQIEGKFDHPGNNLMPTGRIIYNSSILPIFKECLKESPNKEVSEIPVLNMGITRGHEFAAIEINGYFFDTGIPSGFEYANKRLFELSKEVLL